MRTETLGGLRTHIVGGTDGQGGGDGPLVVLMHGFGAPGTDLVGLAGALRLGPATRVAFPEAPLALPREIFGPGGGRAWWMLDLEKLQRAMMTGIPRDLSGEDPDTLPAVRKQILQMLVELESLLGASPEQTVLGGFSQGAMLTMEVALESSRPFAGLALLSGSLLAGERWRPLMQHRAGLRVFQSHGQQDNVLGFEGAEALHNALEAAGIDKRWVPFRGGHEIPMAALQGLNDFLAETGHGP